MSAPELKAENQRTSCSGWPRSGTMCGFPPATALAVTASLRPGWFQPVGV